MEKQLHSFEPTDTEGHSMTCTVCGKSISIENVEEWDNGLAETCKG